MYLLIRYFDSLEKPFFHPLMIFTEKSEAEKIAKEMFIGHVMHEGYIYEPDDVLPDLDPIPDRMGLQGNIVFDIGLVDDIRFVVFEVNVDKECKYTSNLSIKG